MDVAVEYFRSLADRSADFISLSDLQGVPFYVNAAALRLVGLDSLETLPQTVVTEFFFPEDRALILNEFLPGVLREGQDEIEIRFRHFKTGDAIWVNYKAFTLKGATGQPLGFATVGRDITVTRRAEEAVREADRQKDVFIATLGHELRQPVAAILPALSLMRQRVNQHTGIRAREAVERQVAHLHRIIDDLLDVARVTEGKIDLQKRRIDVRTVIEDALSGMSPMLDAQGCSVSASMPSFDVWIDADPTRLHQVLSNLLTNAVKYTNQGGRIWLSVEADDEAVTVSVRDDGRGIAPDALPHVFELFMRGDAQACAGLGIGLTVVRGLVELHGGTVIARSDGIGKGSEFVVMLPALAAVTT